MTIFPFEDRVVLKPLEPETKTPGGILLPDSAKEKPQKGQVVAFGPGKMRECGSRSEMTVAIGDIVLFPRYGGYEIKVGDTEYTIISEEQLLAKVS